MYTSPKVGLLPLQKRDSVQTLQIKLYIGAVGVSYPDGIWNCDNKAARQWHLNNTKRPDTHGPLPVSCPCVFRNNKHKTEAVATFPWVMQKMSSSVQQMRDTITNPEEELETGDGASEACNLVTLHAVSYWYSRQTERISICDLKGIADCCCC